MQHPTGSRPRPRLRTAFLAVALGMAPGIVLIAGLAADAFVAPSAHEVHTPDATPVTASWIDSSEQAEWVPGQPTQSFADLRCRLPNSRAAVPCPQLIEGSAPTLYVVQTLCVAPPNSSFTYTGHNLEYFASSRTLVIHCYIAMPWLYGRGPMGVAAIPRAALLVVSTSSMQPGTIKIVEDDRVEHLFGDQSDQFQIATATIS